ncbi:lipoate--protein ligase [Miniphocaeibacter massiliensis]|uniref:lipoate--protein ligase n=1 Tax=Miniphocaeibacter massiliensis TaxID=2041841 RepID=UPI000C1C1F1A|nr:lipoate--protein ligase [Miniphocaeibacter massiliensis]
MIVVKSPYNRIAYNLALENYVFNNYSDDIFMVWRNNPCVVIGRNQNIYKEVNIKYCDDNNIDIVRRLSGGGAVFQDMEVIQYSFITKEREGNSFEYFTKPVLIALEKLGLKGEFTGRNDLVIDGKKFSGNAQYHRNGKVLHHGTILFGGNLEMLKNALKPNPLKFVGKNVKSVVSRVGRLKDEIELTAPEFMDHLNDTVMEVFDIDHITEINDIEREKVENIVAERFGNESWNYGMTPKFEINVEEKHDFGIVEYGISLDKGKVAKFLINGDFFGNDEVDKLTDKFIGLNFKEQEFSKVLETVDIDFYINGMTNKMFINDLFKER